MDNRFLDKTHWSEKLGAYLDYGLHSEDVSLVRPKLKKGQNPHEPRQKIRTVHMEPQYQFVNQVGYVSKCLVSILQTLLLR